MDWVLHLPKIKFAHISKTVLRRAKRRPLDPPKLYTPNYVQLYLLTFDEKIMLDLGPTTTQNQVCSYLENGASEGKTEPARPPKPSTLYPNQSQAYAWTCDEKKIKFDMDLGLTPTQNRVCSYLENGASEGKTAPARPPKVYTPTNLSPTY